MGVLKENKLGNIKKELKIKELVKGNKQARLSRGSTTSILVVSAFSKLESLLASLALSLNRPYFTK